MNKVIIVNNNLETGGVQTSLVNLLKEIKDKYDVTLLLYYAKPEQVSRIPDGVKLEIVRTPFKHLGSFARDARKNPFMYMARAFWVILARIFGRSFVVRLMLLFQKEYSGYDYAISFLHEGDPHLLYGGCNEFVLSKIDAKKKIGWIHCDFGLCGANNPKSRGIYERFDTIVACSEGCRRAFLGCLPEFADKIVSIRNCNDYEQIRSLAGDGVEYDKDCFNIVTVARLSAEKGIERALEAISECIKAGHKIKYHIVGSGDQERLLRQRVADLGLSDAVVFYGNKENPYPYMKNADLFLLTSYHEAAPMVFDEAACLGVPVLATETTSTYEMIEACGHGFVCENSKNAITSKLFEVLSSRDKLCEMKERMDSEMFDNSSSLDKIKKILE